MTVFETRPVVITGAGSGIGAALAHEAAARGAGVVVVCDIDGAAAESVASSIGGRAAARTVDVTDTDAVFALADEVVDAFGPPGLVCANAGVTPPSGPSLDLDLTDALWVLGVNTVGALATLQAFGRKLIADTAPSWLLVTASEHALGRPHSGLGMYTASKHAVLGLCDVIRSELPDHVGLSVLCPGLTRSGLASSATRRPDAFGGAGSPDPMGEMVLARGMGASHVATRAFDGVTAGRFLIATHFNSLAYAVERHDEVREAFDRLAEVDTSSWDVEQIVAELAGAVGDGGESNHPQIKEQTMTTLAPGDINLASQDDMAMLGSAPWDYFEVLRREAPVFWNPPPDRFDERMPVPGFWVLSKYDDVRAASRDAATYSAYEDSIFWFDVANSAFDLDAHRSGLMGMDPPDHTRYRRLVQPEFTARSIAALEPWIREQAHAVIKEIAARDTAEFVFEVAAELPMIVLCHMMGVPQARRAEYLRLGNGVANIEFDENVEATQFELFCFLLEQIERAEELDEHTMLYRYLNGDFDGRTLAIEEIAQFFVTLSIAGHETTRNSTAHFVRLMDEHPDQKALLLEDVEGRMPNAIEEVLRHSPPVMQFCRTVTQDTEMRGQQIRKGDKVYLSYLSANRDECVFEDPNRFDILRPNANHHLAFGTGPHACMGGGLARTQLRLILTELYTRLPDISLLGEYTPMNSVWFNGITEMPVATCPMSH